MRIAYDGNPLVGERFGIGHYTDQLIRAMARIDADTRCVVVCPWPVNHFRPLAPLSFAQPNVEVPSPPFPTRLRRRVRELVGAPASLEALIGAVDVFHATNFLLTHPVERAKRVVTFHDLTVMLFPQWHPEKRLREMRAGLPVAAAAADRIITVSHVTKSDVVKHLAVDPDRVDVVPLAVDTSFHPRTRAEVDAALAQLGLAYGEYLLFLGTLEPRKNLGRLLDAAIMAGPDVGPLVLAGADGWGTDELRPRIADLARQGRVRPLGYVAPELRPLLLSGARLFTYPSLYEGFGLPPLEAMACGTPVITSNVSALPETVGDAALLVDPLDVGDLAGCIRRLWDDGALRGQLRERGFRRVRDFTWEATARLTNQTYAAAMGS